MLILRTNQRVQQDRWTQDKHRKNGVSQLMIVNWSVEEKKKAPLVKKNQHSRSMNDIPAPQQNTCS